MSRRKLPGPIMDTVEKTRDLVQQLLARGMTYIQIAGALGDRVSSRTVYRWAKGENAPQRRADLIALEHLVNTSRGNKNRLE